MLGFNEHQERLWSGMLQSVEKFREGKITFSKFVGGLEGALDAGEFKDQQLITSWYGVWTPLEIARSQKGNNVDRLKIDKDIDAMKQFLEKNMTKE